MLGSKEVLIIMVQNCYNVKRTDSWTEIPILFKFMISMLVVAIIPIVLLGIVSIGGPASIMAILGFQATIILLAIITLSSVLLWGFFLAGSVTSQIVKRGYH